MYRVTVTVFSGSERIGLSGCQGHPPKIMTAMTAVFDLFMTEKSLLGYLKLQVKEHKENASFERLALLKYIRQRRTPE